MGQPRGTQRYMVIARVDEDGLTQAILRLAAQYGRYGYRRITQLLNEAGWDVGTDRVQRIWRREGLKVPAKQPNAGVCGSTTAHASVCGRIGPTMSGPTILSKPRPMMAAKSG